MFQIGIIVGTVIRTIKNLLYKDRVYSRIYEQYDVKEKGTFDTKSLKKDQRYIFNKINRRIVQKLGAIVE